MARAEKTVFISYRRTDSDGPWALSIFQWLTQHGYDVFLDHDGIASGSFETVIVDNILARAHFLVLLSPTALDRCDQPDDWLRREIEEAIAAARNIVPILLPGFKFGAPPVKAKLTGGIAPLSAYNGLEISSATFGDRMQQLSSKFLNVALSTVAHPASALALRVANKKKAAADTALVESVELQHDKGIPSGLASELAEEHTSPRTQEQQPKAAVQSPPLQVNQTRAEVRTGRAEYRTWYAAKFNTSRLSLSLVRTGILHQPVALTNVFQTPDVTASIRDTANNYDRVAALDREVQSQLDDRPEELRTIYFDDQECADLPERRLSLDHYLDKTDSLLIVGLPGQGKTTCLHIYALRLLDTRGSNSIGRVPIFLRLSSWLSSDTSLWGAAQRLSRADVWTFLSECKNAGSNFSWLLDGADELSGAAVRESFFDAVAAHLRQFSADQIVLTTRPAGLQSDLFVACQGFPKLKLAPLSNMQSEGLINSWLLADVHERQDALKQASLFTMHLHDRPDLRRVITNPLLLTIAVIFFRSDGSLPIDRGSFNRQAIEFFIGEWPKGRSGLELDVATLLDLERAFEHLAFNLSLARTIHFSTGQLYTAAQQAASARGKSRQEQDTCGVRACELLDRDLIGVAYRVSDTQYGFVHLTFQEYLAARHLARLDVDERAKHAHLLVRPEWLECLKYLYSELRSNPGICPGADDLLADLYNHCHDTRSGNILAAKMIGASPSVASPRVQAVYSWIRSSLVSSNLVEIIAVTDGLLDWDYPIPDAIIDTLLHLGDHDQEYRVAKAKYEEILLQQVVFSKRLVEWVVGRLESPESMPANVLRRLQALSAESSIRQAVVRLISAEQPERTREQAIRVLSIQVSFQPAVYAEILAVAKQRTALRLASIAFAELARYSQDDLAIAILADEQATLDVPNCLAATEFFLDRILRDRAVSPHRAACRKLIKKLSIDQSADLISDARRLMRNQRIITSNLVDLETYGNVLTNSQLESLIRFSLLCGSRLLWFESISYIRCIIGMPLGKKWLWSMLTVQPSLFMTLAQLDASTASGDADFANKVLVRAIVSNGKYHDSGKSIQSEVIYAGSTQPEADRGIGRTNRLTGGVHSPGIGVLLSNTVLGWYGLSRREILAKDSGAIFALIVSERVIASPALSGLLRETMRDEQARRAEMTKEGQRIDDPMRPQWSLEFFQHLSQTRREG